MGITDAETGGVVEVVVEVDAVRDITAVRIDDVHAARVVVRVGQLAHVARGDVRIVAAFLDVGADQQAVQRRDTHRSEPAGEVFLLHDGGVGGSHGLPARGATTHEEDRLGNVEPRVRALGIQVCLEKAVESRHDGAQVARTAEKRRLRQWHTIGGNRLEVPGARQRGGVDVVEEIALRRIASEGTLDLEAIVVREGGGRRERQQQYRGQAA